jgi:ABC-type transport system substrate-binding protein
MTFPTFAQWKHFFKIITRKEKAALLALALGAVGSFSVLTNHLYLNNTIAVPDEKGIFTEGEIGSPRFLNPVFSESYDVDRDIVELLYSGLMKYDETGKIVPDLASEYKITNEGKTYEFILKDGLFWSDGKKITADDVVYTIKTISDPAYKSPLRARWLGVTAEKISDTSLRLTLKNPYSSFLENCTLKILPRHIWEKVPADNFALSPFNLEPVGSGPFMLEKINKTKDGEITSIDLKRNPEYYSKKPYLERFTFMFFEDYDSLVTAFKRGVIQGFSSNLSDETTAGNHYRGSTANVFSFPRYFAAFFNAQTAKTLSDAAVRQALNYATDKNDILKNNLNGKGTIVDSPILPALFNYSGPQSVYNYDPAKARELLDKAEYKTGDDGMRVKTVNKQPAFQFNKNLKKGSAAASDVKELQKCLQKEVMPDLEASGTYGPLTVEAVSKFQEKYRSEILDPAGIAKPTGEVLKATRTKLNAVCFPSGAENTPLQFTIATVNQPILLGVASSLKEQWEKIGIKTEIQGYDIATLERDVIKPRNYQILLFGEVLGTIPDPFPFWHSTQIVDPGLNLSLYENSDCDKLLKEIRETLDAEERAKKLESFQDRLIKDSPAVFLYNQNYYYLSSGIKGIGTGIIVDPSKRFAGVQNWYLKERRIWK